MPYIVTGLGRVSQDGASSERTMSDGGQRKESEVAHKRDAHARYFLCGRSG